MFQLILALEKSLLSFALSFSSYFYFYSEAAINFLIKIQLECHYCFRSNNEHSVIPRESGCLLGFLFFPIHTCQVSIVFADLHLDHISAQS